MRALLLYPKFPRTFWSFDTVLELIGKKALFPPLGLITVAGMLPNDWQIKLIDCNIGEVDEADWNWADIILLTGMIVQKDHLFELLAAARVREKVTVVGGPFATSTPGLVEDAGADYLVLDEGEITVPLFLIHAGKEGLHLRKPGSPAWRFTAGGERPELTTTPLPRFELLNLAAYDGMAVQFSRGCPFLCEFCDIITLYGRRPRTKAAQQLLDELTSLYELGWKGPIFLVDDNFIGNKPNIKKLLPELIAWQKSHGFPFSFDTEASIDLAADTEMMRAMVNAGFAAVFIGIETPDTESLELIRKHQNNRRSMIDSVHTIAQHGLRVMSGMIIGFDGERSGADERIVDFIEQAAIPVVVLSMLQALPNTALWMRLDKERRLSDNETGLNQTVLMNFSPTRPVVEIASEYVRAYEQIYDARKYMDRTFRHFMMRVRPPTNKPSPLPTIRQDDRPRLALRTTLYRKWHLFQALFTILFKQGVLRKTRWMFWHHSWIIARTKPHMLNEFFAICAQYEHFVVFTSLVRSEIKNKMKSLRNHDADAADALANGWHPITKPQE